MKRLQVMLKNETYTKIETLVAKCNEGFEEGNVRTQDVVEWLIQNSTADVQKIRARCVNINKILKNAKVKTRADLKELVKKMNQAEFCLDDLEASQ